MEKLTFKLAKELSEEKWKYITNNNGDDSGVFIKIPVIEFMRSQCAMCQFIEDSNFNSIDCDTCNYDEICSTLYQKWYNDKTAENSANVLNAIRITNDKLSDIFEETL